ncbi:hypothetical protein XENOCAPTIV_030566 [Xenoophorus captivus]|uniref:Uncharacterized protein n=1 Tax=Xenoophorus captivus TaxID=1517983 RepID=A0ABV0QUH6_9TELE
MVALFPRHATQKPVNHPFIAVGCVSAGKHLVPRIRGNQSEVVDLTPHLSMLLSHQSPIGADPAGSDDYSAPIGPDDISQTRAGGPVQPVLKVLFKIQHGKRKKAL